MSDVSNAAPGTAALNQLKQMAVSNLQGRMAPTADALLNRAHRDAVDRGFVIVGFRSEVVLPPTGPQSLCIVKAIVLMKSLYEEGQPVYEFEGLGDADTVTGARVNGRIVALAETRARTRALIAALNAEEEVNTSSGAPAAASAPAGFAQAAVPQQAVAASAPGQYQGFKGGIIPMGKHKGKHLTDPSIPLSDLEWFKTLTMQDRVTPDLAKQADAIAEIARRTQAGGAPAAAFAAPPAQSGPAASQLPPPPPGASVFAQPQAAAPVALSASVPPASPPAPLASGLDASTIARLAQLGASKGFAWPTLTELIKSEYKVADPTHLTPAQAQDIEARLAATPTASAV